MSDNSSVTGHRTIRIFISSPADVRPERLKTEQMVARLDREFSYHFRVEAVLWERQPLLAAYHFQDPPNIPQPRTTDIVVVILWTRLGQRLPERFQGALSGQPVTGTEWEFEDALAGARKSGAPNLLVYRKTAEKLTSLGDRAAVNERLTQLDLLENFIARWFGSPDEPASAAAFKTFTTSAEFEERVYDDLRQLLRPRISRPNETDAIRWHEPPFRGLLSFEYEHAPIFFGRSRARNELRELLAQQSERGRGFILLLGASGSGKSSLVKAGLIPDLMLPGMIGRVAVCRRAFLRPSDQPEDLLRGLAKAIFAITALPELASLRYTVERLTNLLRRAPDQCALAIEQGLAEVGMKADLTDIAETRLALVVDQLEELFTQEQLNDSDRDEFINAIDALAHSGFVWVIATLRSDFYDRLGTLPSLARLASAEARYDLSPPDYAELDQIIRQPTYEAGLSFEFDLHAKNSLADLIREAAKDCRALPLLSFVLEQLWLRRTDQGGLTFKAYRDLGGLEGALGKRADQVFSMQLPEVQAALPTVLRALIAIDVRERGVSTARPTPLSAFPEGGPERRLIEAFCAPDARLLVMGMGEGTGGGPWVRVAHEALLTHWEIARSLIADDLADLELASSLKLEAERWSNAPVGSRNRLLPAGPELTRVRHLLERRRDELDVNVIRYVEAALSQEAKTMRSGGQGWLRLSQRGMIALGVLALILGSIITNFQGRLSPLSFDIHEWLSVNGLSVRGLRFDRSLLAEMGVASGIGITLILVLPRIGGLFCAVFSAAAMVLLLVFAHAQVLIDPIYPWAVFSTVYLVASLLDYRRTEARQHQIRRTFSRYMSPHVVEELARHPERLRLGGQVRSMTIMFCDIRGFTGLSEHLDAEILTRFMNSFLSPMTEIITEHKGTIDKYIGTCIMAFWNAPLDDPDHAKNAVRAAQAMRRKLIELNRDWRAEPAYQVFLPVRIGIGINTGECVVGNFGSEAHFDYSLLGDPVNLASRLEGLGKVYGIDLIIGEETAPGLDDPALIEIDLVAIKGQSQAARIYTIPPDPVLGDDFIRAHSALLTAYRRQDWSAALRLLDSGLAAVHHLAPVYDLYRRRIAQFQIEAPPTNWDGVFE